MSAGPRNYLGWLSLFLLLPLLSCGDLLGTAGTGSPRVLSSDPKEGARNVPVHTVVRIRFSSDLDPPTVTGAVNLVRAGRPLQVLVSLRNRREVVLEPTDPLDFGTSFKVTVDTSLRSRSGKFLSDPQSWDFSTEGAPLPEPSQVLLRGHLEVLAHDSMRGRGSGTEDERRAAAYVESFFGANDLLGPPGGRLQSFEAYSEKAGRTIQSLNVLSTASGSGSLGEEWVLVGAHYDHVGVRRSPEGSMEIHNGADDNASGTALLLEMARIYGAYVTAGGMAGTDRRSVLFVAFGAEEQGLLGSCHYARVDPVVPMSAITAMINLDMVGRLRNGRLEIRRNGSSPEWAPLVANANRPGLQLYEPPGFCEGCSDFACFKEQGVPFIWFFTGAHAEYHTPADDVELINSQGLVDVGEVGLRTLIRLVTKSDPLR